ncbi:long-chain fatty acid--CoA ligase [candidate division KSB1 bacterium]|nr:long-chain fatty acid--CoA ligase [candidate division KSB1 bacterium]
MPQPWLKHYDLGVPDKIYIPRITLNDIMQHSADIHKNRIAFRFFGKKFTFHKMESIVQCFAAAFHDVGIRKGDRIALLLPNTPQFLFSYWGALRIGAIVVPINPLLAGREISALLDIVNPKIFIALDSIYEKIDQQKKLQKIDHIILTAVDEFMPTLARLVFSLQRRRFGKSGKTKHLSGIQFKNLAKKRPLLSLENVRPADTAALIFTGGVTGIPKAVELTHQNLVANLLQTRAWLGDIRDGHDRVMGVLPFFHSYGMTTCHHLAIQVGATLIVEPRFNVQRIIRLIKKYKVTIFPGVPTMYRAIVDVISETKQRLDDVRVCVSGGAPLSATLKREFEQLTSSKLVEGYGLSEASPLTHCNPLFGKQKPGSIGLPCPNTQARIVHIKTGETVPPDTKGELWVKGPQVMRAYWKNEAETRKVLSADGWLATGDIARMDQDGYFYIIDRKKEIILSGGFNIYPSEVEAVLLMRPEVKECAVIGIPDNFYGEIVKAFVVLQRGKLCEEQDLLAFCRINLAHFKVPKNITFVQSLPKNFLGKVLKRNLIQSTNTSSK